MGSDLLLLLHAVSVLMVMLIISITMQRAAGDICQVC